MKPITLVTGVFQTNTYIFEAEKSIVIIDPGDDADKIAQIALEIGKPIKHILLTHAHYDHVGAVGLLQKVGAKVYLHKSDFENVKSGEYVFGKVTPDVLLEKDEIFNIDNLKIQNLHTPGHSAGSTCYIVDDIMFSGDTLFLEEIGRCDLPSGDLEVMKKTLKRLFDIFRVEGKDYQVLPGHGATTTLSHEAKYNPYANS